MSLTRFCIFKYFCEFCRNHEISSRFYVNYLVSTLLKSLELKLSLINLNFFVYQNFFTYFNFSNLTRMGVKWHIPSMALPLIWPVRASANPDTGYLSHTCPVHRNRITTIQNSYTDKNRLTGPDINGFRQPTEPKFQSSPDF